MEENGFIYSSWGDPELEDMWYRMQKKAKETEEEKKRKRTEELRKDMENVNHTKIEKDFAKTLVCDGAILECPQGYFDYPVPDIHEADDRYMPDSVTATRTEMIKFNDKGTQGLLSSGNAPTGFQREPQEIKGSSLAIKILCLPCLSKNSSMFFNAPLEVSFSTGSLPKVLAIKKQSAAPTMALLQESKAPFQKPNSAAFAKVIKKAGSGATTDCKTMSRKEIAAA